MRSVRESQISPGSAIDLRFVHVEEKIRHVLCSILRTRRLSVSISDFCAQADITRPTFAAHCDSVTDALQRYEQALLEAYKQQLELWQRNPATDRETTFTSLLGFVYQNQEYFLATLPNHNYILVHTMLELIMPPSLATPGSIVSNDITLVGTISYVRNILLHHQIALVSSWTEHYHLAKPQLAVYAKLMVNEEQQALRSLKHSPQQTKITPQSVLFVNGAPD